MTKSDARELLKTIKQAFAAKQKEAKVFRENNPLDSDLWRSLMTAYIYALDMAIEALKEPSAQTEQKKGHWIPVDDPSITGRCSVCGFESHLCEDDVYGYDYCPNCGARLEMVEE